MAKVHARATMEVKETGVKGERPKRIREVARLGNIDVVQSTNDERSLRRRVERSKAAVNGGVTNTIREPSEKKDMKVTAAVTAPTRHEGQEPNKNSRVSTNEHFTELPATSVEAVSIPELSDTAKKRLVETPHSQSGNQTDPGRIPNEEGDEEEKDDIEQEDSGTEPPQQQNNETSRSRERKRPRRAARIGMTKKRKRSLPTRASANAGPSPASGSHGGEEGDGVVLAEPAARDIPSRLSTSTPINAAPHDAASTATTPAAPATGGVNGNDVCASADPRENVLSSPARRRVQEVRAAVQIARENAKRRMVLRRTAKSIGALKPLPRRFHQHSQWGTLSPVTPDPAGILYRPRVEGKREPLWAITLGTTTSRKPPVWRVCHAPHKENAAKTPTVDV